MSASWLAPFVHAPVAVAVLLTGATLPTAGSAPAPIPNVTPPPTVTRQYAASSADVANPGRGAYHYTEARLSWSLGYAALDEQQLRTWRTAEAVSVVYRIVYLEKYRDVDTIDPADLARVSADLATARRAGVKLVLRFAYTDSSSADAPVARVVGHVRQLAPVLNAGADVLASLQAGFVGQWGEWYYSDHFTSTPGSPWLLSDADWQRRGQVLHALLDATLPQIPVQVRYPSVKQRLLAGDPAASRVGIHDDCFLAGTDDYGTYPTAGDRAWTADQTRTVAMGGETCAANAPRSSWPNAATELATYHWSFLNSDFDRSVLDSWGPDGWAETKRRLGYRLRLVQGTFPTSAQAGAPLALQLTLTNDGWAAPLTARPVQLVMRAATSTYRLPLALDVRSLQPGQTVSVPLRVTAPPVAGTYALGLALPDPAPSLAGRPEYAVQLADTGLWDAAQGVNDLQDTVRVDPASGVSPSPAVTAVSSLTPGAAVNGWGPWERDTSNGEAAPGDGRPIALRGRPFASGLGVHSASSLTYDLGGATSFSATVGIDDETSGRGSAVFQVWVDGVLRWTSPVLGGSAAPLPVTVPVAGARSLRLVVTDAGDGPAYDHADWAGAALTR